MLPEITRDILADRLGGFLARFAREIDLGERLLGDDAESLPGVLFVLRLQVSGELLVCLVGDDGQAIDLRVVDPLAVLVDGEP